MIYMCLHTALRAERVEGLSHFRVVEAVAEFRVAGTQLRNFLRNGFIPQHAVRHQVRQLFELRLAKAEARHFGNASAAPLA